MVESELLTVSYQVVNEVCLNRIAPERSGANSPNRACSPCGVKETHSRPSPEDAHRAFGTEAQVAERMWRARCSTKIETRRDEDLPARLPPRLGWTVCLGSVVEFVRVGEGKKLDREGWKVAEVWPRGD
jgi:hypothetical protein